MNLMRLREMLAGEVHHLSQIHRHVDLDHVAQEIGVGSPGSQDSGSKAERMRAALAAVLDEDLPSVAKRVLQSFPPPPARRNQIEDLLWATENAVSVPKLYRRELATRIAVGDLWLDAQRFLNLLERVWVLDRASPFCGRHGISLRDEIWHHLFEGADLSTAGLFDHLGAYDCCDRRFAAFIEGLSSSDVRPDVASQHRFVSMVNEVLCKCGVELIEIGEDGGYPLFSTRAKGQGSSRPKNLIFASAVKPDLRFRDAIDNDIEIVTNADKVLVYDRSIGAEGLRWRDLQAWWAESTARANGKEAKSSLYRRLESSLPPSSPPQHLMFTAFYGGFGAQVPDLPALLPEVWLHWDPRTVQARGRDALLRCRMDFLLLLPGGCRVVVEVDGQQHYSERSGLASPARYARMMAADRELRLVGYEVYRFGATELIGERGCRTAETFFRTLFQRHGVLKAAGGT